MCSSCGGGGRFSCLAFFEGCPSSAVRTNTAYDGAAYDDDIMTMTGMLMTAQSAGPARRRLLFALSELSAPRRVVMGLSSQIEIRMSHRQRAGGMRGSYRTIMIRI